ncbi:ribbon-helix-helix protein, CopG family (plasmid) [Priestia megaterium]|uniref:ribbon-helix-helix protein, CopG family n=1 Tax=Priestia megaterium TaxID=1404 RepID=UPI0038A11E5D
MDIIIRNIGKEYVKAIDEKAKALNVSRNEFLNRYLIGYAHHREALGRTRLEKFLNETQQQMYAQC